MRGGAISLRKSLGILVLSTQAVIAFDYNMQSRKAGLAPGELSMKAYMAIVQQRYGPEPASRFAEDQQGSGLWRRARAFGSGVAESLSGSRELAEATPLPAQEEPGTVCIRRGTLLDCQ